MNVQDRRIQSLSVRQLLGLLQLRSEVFVVEQNCVYQDLDGRDEHIQTRHIWLEDEETHQVVAYLRLLEEDGTHRIGRVVTRAQHRGQGHSATLLDYAIGHSQGPWVLSAQCQLEAWYQRFGFSRCGGNYLEDGIPHLPMLRTQASR